MSAAPTMLALPSGERNRSPHGLSVATLLAGAAELLLVGALVASYLNVRALSDPWPTEGVHLDNYVGTVMFITLVLSAITAEWAVYALRRDNRRQASTALGLTAGLGASFINLLWYAAREFHFGPADHAYAVIAYALVIAVGVIAALGIGYLLVALARTIGGQATPGNPTMVRAAALHWHVVITAYLLMFLALYVLQHR